MEKASGALRLLPLALVLAGLVIPLVATGFTVWPLTAFWAVIVGALVLIETRRPSSRKARIRVTSLAILVLLLAAWEGGWWLIPAAVCQVLVDIFLPESSTTRVMGKSGEGIREPRF